MIRESGSDAMQNMRLSYNGVALDELGVLRILGERSELSPADDAPRSRRVSLSVRLDFFSEASPDWAALRSKQGSVLSALRTSNGRLLWVDDVSGTTLVDQDAVLSSHDLPEDPNAWGSYRQAVTFTFTYADHDFTPDVMGCTYTPAGGMAVTLGAVERFREKYTTERYDPLRDNRRRAGGQMTFVGRFLCSDPAAERSARRTELLDKLADIRTAFTSKSGRLVYGNGDNTAFDQTVRVEDLEAEVNQAHTEINWSFSAAYNRFPDESGYALADYTVTSREDKDAGTVTTVMAGRIAADSRASADTKLAVLRALHAGSLTLIGTRELAEQHYDTPDGHAFTELTFNETYRTTSGTATEWSLRLRAAGDIRAGMVRHTWSGHVVASATTWMGAYQVAVAKARALAEHKHQLLLGHEFTVDDNQQSADRVTTGNVTVRVEFSFDYQLRGERAFIEVTGEVAKDTFGPDSERVSGSIVAATRAAADGFLDLILAGYTGRIIRNRRTSASGVQIQNDGSAPTGSTTTPPSLTGGAADTVNTGEPAPGSVSGFTGQFIKLDFAFEVFLAKGDSDLAVRYSLHIQANYVSRQKSSSLQGTVAGNNRADCAWVVETIAAAFSLGSLIEESSGEDREKFLGTRAATTDDLPAGTTTTAESYGGVLVNYQFSRSYRDRLRTEVATVLDCEVSEDIEHSGTRWVRNPTAYGNDVMQACGIKSGTRTVSVRCLAATEAQAWAWAKRQLDWLPFVANDSTAPGTRYLDPPRFRIAPKFVPMTNGVVRADGVYAAADDVNVECWEISGSREEALPDYAYVPGE